MPMPSDPATSGTADPADTPDYETRTLTQLWSFETGGDINDSPRVDGQYVYLAAEGAGVFALDTASGEEVWHYAPAQGVWGRSLALAGDSLLVGLASQELVSLDTRTGEERWRAALTGEVQRPPLVAGDVIYVGTAFVGPGLESQPERQAWVYALDAASGDMVWSFETDNYLVVSPALSSETLYAGGSYYDPSRDVAEGGPMRVYAFDTTSGTVQWTFESDAGLIKRLYASDELVYYLAYQDMLFTLEADTGTEAWLYHTANWTPDFLFADGVIYFGVGNGFMHAVDARSGEQLWKTRLDIFRRPLEAPLLVDGLLYLHVAQQQIFVLDAASGALLWVIEHDIASREALVIDGERMYLVGTDGVLYAAEAP
jgi:outer membrane protein assembly factor BamB